MGLAISKIDATNEPGKAKMLELLNVGKVHNKDDFKFLTFNDVKPFLGVL